MIALFLRRSCLLAFATLLAPIGVRADAVTVVLSAGTLFDSTGTALPAGNLVLLLADTNHDGFTSFFAGGSLTEGSFLDGNDQILGRLFTDSQGTVGDQFNSIPIGSGLYSTLTAGDPIAIAWFPGLTSGTSSLTAGNAYGLFSGTSPTDGSPWVIPASGTITLHFFTDTFSPGSHADIQGRASLTVTAVPEPSTYAVGLALVALGFAMLRRRHRLMQSA